MRLTELLARAGLDAAGAGDQAVTGFAIDHRKVAPGTIFGAFQGATVNGEQRNAAAVENLLTVTRLEEGGVRPQADAELVDDLVEE